MKKRLSFSSLKAFSECEAEAVAVMRGEWDRQATFPPSTIEAMNAGSYVHKYFESEEALNEFKKEHASDMFTKKGTLKSQFQIAEKIVKALDKDPLFKAIYQGSKELEIFGKIQGIEFHGFVDCLNLERNIFIDIKTVRGSIKDREWLESEHRRVHWIEARKYLWQMAIYQELLRQSDDEKRGKKISPVIYAVTKETFPDSAGITVPQDWLDDSLVTVCEAIDKYIEVLNGRMPNRCERCNYCKATKRNLSTISYSDLI
ncbi:PD-(D/E)XK nuclease-like domain-containing protein [Lactococcus taiwanensis]|uniref:PD-(D/E)XK nuclease-like domain-containing protein n=1 Tax=Lactococcus taiwanensis TaxID=1151742 RepID=UPI003518C396